MKNYDDEINDLLDRVETLEEGGGGGGGTTSAINVIYDDYPTDYGANNVQGVLEKIKTLLGNFLQLTGGILNGNIAFINDKGIQGIDTKGNEARVMKLASFDHIVVGDDGYPLRLYGGQTAEDGTKNGVYCVLIGDRFYPSVNNAVNLGLTNRRWSNVNAVNGNFTGDLAVSGAIDGVTTGNALPISVIDTSLSGQVITSGATTTVTINVAKDGLTPIGIVGVNFSGSGNTGCGVDRFLINNSNALIVIHNRSTVNATINVRVFVLYQLDNGTPVVVSEPLEMDMTESI